MSMTNVILKKILTDGAIKIYPYDKHLENLGFYIIINKSSRVKEEVYQMTLFMKDKPYLHRLISNKELIEELECNCCIYDNFLKSNICDNLIYDLADIEKMPTEEENKRSEEIQLIVAKYDEYLAEINEEQFKSIKNVFEFYIKNKEETIENVELFLKQTLYIK